MPKEEPNNSPLQEGLDFYMEKGRFVLTEHYLRSRGYCCENGCRHCPYGFKQVDNQKPPVNDRTPE